MDAYLEDLRRKLIDAVEQRMKKCEAGRAFSKLKCNLRGACARNQRRIMEIISEALRKIKASDVEGFFEHCGYRTVVQTL